MKHVTLGMDVGYAWDDDYRYLTEYIDIRQAWKRFLVPETGRFVENK